MRRYSIISKFAAAIIIIGAGTILPQRFLDVLAIFIILLGGIPHGANDWKISQPSSTGTDDKFGHFIFKYILISASFILIWFLFPLKALIIFVALSIYHFGQSEMHATGIKPLKSRTYYFIWGSYATLFPLMYHWPVTMLYIQELTHIPLEVDGQFQSRNISLFLFAMPAAVLAFLRSRNRISRVQLGRELLNIGLLALIYMFTPLLLGFAIYFVLWHTMDSIAQQIAHVRKFRRYHLYRWIRDALPMTGMAVTGFLFIYLFVEPDSIRNYASYAFILISAIALPHILVMDRIYERRNDDTEYTSSATIL